uniref:Uncharacterized protein n=1 Tax=Nicotiana tabacum TaxID=4097 RepID=A0A1S3ZZ37_TOBAC|nr:PREDICTED: uncharacterized protein LOC107791962 [Nicotiana tabacum]
MAIKLVVGGSTMNVISAYAPQAGFDEGVKRRFWETLDERKKRFIQGQPRIKSGVLTKDNMQELEGQLTAMGAWKSGRDASVMWTAMTDYIREAVREVLGVSKGYSGGHRGDWWWNDLVQGNVEANKVAYLKLMESTDEG